MATFLNLLLVALVFQLALTLFVGSAYPGSALYTFFVNPTGWSTSELISLLFDALTIGGLTTIVVGTLLYKSDFLVFAGVSTVFLSFGQSLYHLWQYVNRQAFLGGNVAGNIGVASLIISPIIIMYIYTLLKFWRGSD